MADPDKSHPRWQGHERRAGHPAQAAIDQAVAAAMEQHESDSRRHMDKRFDELKAIMLSGFPENDPAGHRQYHQKQIDYMNERIALWRELRSKGVIGLLWLTLGLLGTAVWEYIKSEVKR
jgi:hypothetical protein